MSLKTWKEEFYPVSANKVSKQDALEHSIKKWEGLRLENLKRHGLIQNRRAITEDRSFAYFNIDSDSCALCQHYAGKNSCIGCPLYHIRHNTKCDVRNFEISVDAVYHEFVNNENPEPMIKELIEARNWVDK